MKQASKAWEEFPKSWDRTLVLKHYAADYSGVNDGANETRKDLEKYFDDLAEQIKLGSAIGVSYTITELNSALSRASRLAYLQDETMMGQGGLLIATLRPNVQHWSGGDGETWLVFHEHCSTVQDMPKLLPFPQGRLGCTLGTGAVVTHGGNGPPPVRSRTSYGGGGRRSVSEKFTNTNTVYLL